MGKKILVAMSGGVDSSVAAHLLQQAGWTVGGATIRTWVSSDCVHRDTKACCGVTGVRDASEVAKKLGIPYHIFNFEKEFKTHVIDYFSKEYLNGRTPNPCIACNQHVKFTLFYERARQLGYDAIATGHYAQVAFDRASGRYFIAQGVDLQKDQSYVLFPLEQEILSHLELPVGSYTKDDIRRIAHDLGLGVAGKPDSQEICFIPSNDYGAFLERERGLSKNQGTVQDQYGNVLGRHDGYYHYTIGQRQGLKIPFKHALYVIDIIPEKNLVIAGNKTEVLSHGCEVEGINWFISLSGTEKLRSEVKIRSRHEKAWAHLRKVSDSSVHVYFDEPQEAITPGQGCVFYNGGQVLGGGWISKRIKGEGDLNGGSQAISSFTANSV